MTSTILPYQNKLSGSYSKEVSFAAVTSSAHNQYVRKMGVGFSNITVGYTLQYVKLNASELLAVETLFSNQTLDDTIEWKSPLDFASGFYRKPTSWEREVTYVLEGETGATTRVAYTNVSFKLEQVTSFVASFAAMAYLFEPPVAPSFPTNLTTVNRTISAPFHPSGTSLGKIPTSFIYADNFYYSAQAANYLYYVPLAAGNSVSLGVAQASPGFLVGNKYYSSYGTSSRRSLPDYLHEAACPSGKTITKEKTPSEVYKYGNTGAGIYKYNIADLSIAETFSLLTIPDDDLVNVLTGGLGASIEALCFADGYFTILVSRIPIIAYPNVSYFKLRVNFAGDFILTPFPAYTQVRASYFDDRVSYFLHNTQTLANTVLIEDSGGTQIATFSVPNFPVDSYAGNLYGCMFVQYIAEYEVIVYCEGIGNGGSFIPVANPVYPTTIHVYSMLGVLKYSYSTTSNDTWLSPLSVDKTDGNLPVYFLEKNKLHKLA